MRRFLSNYFDLLLLLLLLSSSSSSSLCRPPVGGCIVCFTPSICLFTATTKLKTEDVRSEVTQVSGRAFLRSQGVKGHDQWSKVVTGAEMWKSLLGHTFMKNVSTHIKWIPRWHPIPRCTFCLHGVSKKTGSLFKQSVKNRIRSVHTKNN